MTIQIPPRLTGHTRPVLTGHWRCVDAGFVSWVSHLAAQTFQAHNFLDWDLAWKVTSTRTMRAELEVPLLPVRARRESQYFVYVVMDPEVTVGALVEEFGSQHVSDRIVDKMEIQTGLESDFIGWLSYIKEVWIRDWCPNPMTELAVKAADMVWALPLQVADLKAAEMEVEMTVVKERQTLTEGLDIQLHTELLTPLEEE